MATGKIALVTGANRGIGFELCRQLCKEWKGTVVLSARNKEKGEHAVQELAKEGLTASFLELDVCSQTSVNNAVKVFKTQFDGLDILINNAGVLFTVNHRRIGVQSYVQQVKETMTTNFLGMVKVCHAFYPLLRPHGRVVFLSSSLGDMSLLRNDLQRELCNPQLTEDGLIKIMHSYERHVENEDDEEYGWPQQSYEDWRSVAYSVSKIGVTTLARIHAKQMENDEREDILVNACCPGWVRTQMGGPRATRSVEEGAATPLHLALLAPGSLNGVFYKDNEVAKFFTY